MVIERWIKEEGCRIIKIEVVKEYWGYQPMVNGRPIHRMDADLDSLHDTLYGNGCKRRCGKDMYSSCDVKIPSWKIIDWEPILKQIK